VGGRALSHKLELEVIDDFIHHGIVCEEGDDARLGAPLTTKSGSTSRTLRIISAQPLP